MTTQNRKLMNLLAHMLGELYYPEYQSDTYDGADEPTREVVDRYLPRINRLFLKK